MIADEVGIAKGTTNKHFTIQVQRSTFGLMLDYERDSGPGCPLGRHRSGSAKRFAGYFAFRMSDLIAIAV